MKGLELCGDLMLKMGYSCDVNSLKMSPGGIVRPSMFMMLQILAVVQ